jgi:rubrerythrin
MDKEEREGLKKLIHEEVKRRAPHRERMDRQLENYSNIHRCPDCGNGLQQIGYRWWCYECSSYKPGV